MGHIKEPDGVDLIIKSRSLTKEEKIAISSYINAYKAKHSLKKTQSRRVPNKTRKVADQLMKK